MPRAHAALSPGVPGAQVICCPSFPPSKNMLLKKDDGIAGNLGECSSCAAGMFFKPMITSRGWSRRERTWSVQ